MTISNGKPELLQLERDLPTSREDVLALRRARFPETTDLSGYIAFLRSIAAMPVGGCPAGKPRKPTDPFEL